MREAIVKFILVLLVIVLALVLIIIADGWVQAKAAQGRAFTPSVIGHSAVAMLPMSPLFAAVWIWWQNKRRIAKYETDQGE